MMLYQIIKTKVIKQLIQRRAAEQTTFNSLPKNLRSQLHAVSSQSMQWNTYIQSKTLHNAFWDHNRATVSLFLSLSLSLNRYKMQIFGQTPSSHQAVNAIASAISYSLY